MVERRESLHSSKKQKLISMGGHSNYTPTFPLADRLLGQEAMLPLPHLNIPDGGGSSSGYSSYESPTSFGSPSSLLQRSVSSLSLQKKSNNGYYNHHSHLLDMHDSTHVRRVFSTGDLPLQQYCQRAESPLSSESSLIIESMSRASKYSPEEKKERIERYRSKRNQRNFNKKIKYACRKTLADSRPRIRGRFARNDEIEKNVQTQWSNSGEEDEDDDDNWINFLDEFSTNSFA